MSGAASVLLEHVLRIEWSGLSDDERSAAKTFLHDTLCVGVAGRNAPGAEGVLAAALAWCGTPARGCSILGRPGERATAPYAAFVNAFQIHSQEFDCVHEGAVAHPLATVVAALCAEAERSGPYTGADFLAALVGGVDVVATLGVAATSPLKFFRPATAGIFGSVAALCRLRRFSLADSVSAFGNALAFASGTMQAHLEGRPTLALQVAAAARSAVEAIDLVIVGMAGPVGSIDGPFGYLALFEDRHEIAAALATLGKPHRIVELSWKPFPTGRAAHGGIVALQTLQRDHGVTADNLRSFVYRAPPLIARLVGRKAFAGMTPAHARLCLPWLGAMTLLHGKVELSQFTPQGLADGEALALSRCIGVESDGSGNPAAFLPATATAVTRDGREIVIAVERQLGSPAWRLSADEHFQKARANLAFGGMSDAHEPLLRSIDSLHTASDAAEALAAAFGQGAPC